MGRAVPNFQKLLTGIEVVPAVHEIARQPELWDQYQVRTFHEQSAHRTLSDIVLRYNRFDEGDDFVDKVCASIDVEDYPASVRLPYTMSLALGLMTRVRGVHLGRVFVSKIKPGGSIAPHTDRIGPAEEAFPGRIIPAAYYDRHHIVLQSGPGTIFRCGAEEVYMAPGEVWWFDNQVEHCVINNSAVDRVHLIIDIHCTGEVYTPTFTKPRSFLEAAE